ncbi:MAG: hypothetical protein ICV73_16525 [Acetobacteraceae bacterium]|nr:hypothetical protein [Acetobacteraceae bacterium]
MGAAAAIELARRMRETGGAAPAEIGGHREPLPADREDLPREPAAAKPGVAPAEIQAESTGRGIRAGSLTAVWATLRRLGLRHKESRRGQPSGTGPTRRTGAAAGASGSATWVQPASCSPTKPALVLPPTLVRGLRDLPGMLTLYRKLARPMGELPGFINDPFGPFGRQTPGAPGAPGH